MSELYQLPDGWEWKKLDEFVEIKGGKRLPNSKKLVEYKTPYPYIRVSDFNEFGSINLNSLQYITEDVYSEIKNYIISKHDIYISIAGTIGKTGVVPDELDGANLTENAAKLIFDNNNFDKSYLLLFTKSRYFLEQVGLATKVVAMPKLALARLKNVCVPLPLLAEQKRIVQKLDALFERIDKAIALLQKNIAVADNFMNSVLNDVFSDLEQNYEPVELTKYVNFIGGSQPPKSEFSDKEREGYVRLIQIRDYKSDNNIVYVKKTSVRRFCNKDDVMIGRYGPPVFQILRGLDGAYNVALMKAEPNEEFICKDFLFLFLKNPSIQNYIIGLSQRSAGQSGVNKEALEKYLIALPALNKQKEIVLYLNQVSAQIEHVKLAQQQKMQNLLSLKSSILDQAFHGKL